MTNAQAPMSNEIPIPKISMEHLQRHWGLGYWTFIGHWVLEIEHSPPSARLKLTGFSLRTDLHGVARSVWSD